jgi:hypothetical protein
MYYIGNSLYFIYYNIFLICTTVLFLGLVGSYLVPILIRVGTYREVTFSDYFVVVWENMTLTHIEIQIEEKMKKSVVVMSSTLSVEFVTGSLDKYTTNSFNCASYHHFNIKHANLSPLIL